jgi:hypothetical protein
MATVRKFSVEEQRKVLAELEVPFDPAMVEWKVVRRARSGRRGAVLPFADPRAYTDRLNQVLTTAGWSRAFTLSTLSNLTRRLWDGKCISTGKVLVSGTVTINRLGSQPGNGEAWADRDHAVTAAEARAFKRACAGFGLGRYLYRFREVWVALNRYSEPISKPTLPDWALPPGFSASRRGQDARGPLDQGLTAKIESFREVLGGSIYTEILARSGHSHQAGLIPKRDDAKERPRMDGIGFERVRQSASTSGDSGRGKVHVRHRRHEHQLDGGHHKSRNAETPGRHPCDLSQTRRRLTPQHPGSHPRGS